MRGLYFARVDFTGSSVNRDEVPLIQRKITSRKRPLYVIDLQAGSTANADLPHLPCDQGSVRRDASARRKNCFRRNHPAKIFGRGFDPDQDHGLTFMRPLDRVLGIEDNVSAGCTWTRCEPSRDLLGRLDALSIKYRSQ